MQRQVEADLPRSEPGDHGQQPGRRSLRQPKPLCLGVGELRPRQPIRRATSSRLSPAARRRTRAPASRSAIKRTIGSGCAASIAAASVIGSIIGHSARGGVNNNNRKISPATTQVGRPVRPYCFGRRKDPKGRGEPAGLWPMPASPGGACNGSEAAACPGLRSPEAFAAAPPHCTACRRPNRT